MNTNHTIFLRVNPFIYARKKDVQKVYEKLLAHPLFISDYVVYYARVARTFIGFIWFCQIKAVKSRDIFIFCLHFYTYTSYCFDDVHNEHRVQRYKVLVEAANNAAKNVPAPALT